MNKTNLNTIMAKVKMILDKAGNKRTGSIKEFSEAAAKSPVLKTAGWIKYKAPKAEAETEETEHKTVKKTSKK